MLAGHYRLWRLSAAAIALIVFNYWQVTTKAFVSIWGSLYQMDQLLDIPLFDGLDEKQSRKFGQQCIWRDYAANELVIDHSDKTNDVRFVLTGMVRIIIRISAGREVILNDFGPGDYIGELAAIDGETRSANVTTMTSCRLCIMPATVFMEILDKNPAVNRKVLQKLSVLIRRLSDRLAEFTFLQAKYRLYAELIRLSRPRSDHPGQRSISPPPIQREIADRIASRREFVSREMKSLEREGCLMKTRGALVLTNVDELDRRIAEGWRE